ncbi:MAG TPA: DUF4394 domain-containing protein [Pyrinomonadaceae bacterium]|nr:DUF4394 domain-containing protein [Acidobacteriota bacterium]HQZ94796.1 DUF4394 domain-containing protein [Pyrinomonadaceae bacterium]
MKKPIGIFTLVAVLAVAFFAAITWRADAQRLISSGSQPIAENRKDISPELQARMIADREGEIGPGTDLSKVPRAFPEAGTIVYAYENLNKHLISFDASEPGTLLTDIALTGLGDDEIFGLDFRPADGMLYGIATGGFPTPGKLVRINVITGEVVRVHPTNNVPSIIDTFYGFDFDPVEDRIRNVGSQATNRRLDPNTGQLAANDTTLRYAAGDVNAGVVPRVVHIASTTTSGVTTTYGVDIQANTLVRVGGVNGNPSPNGGQLTTIGNLGVDPTNFGSMDIKPGATNAYASLFIDSVPIFVSIDLATGAASIIGRVGGSETQVIDGIAIQTGPIIVPTPTPGLTPTPTPGGSPTPTPTMTPTPTPTPTPTVMPTPTPTVVPTPTPTPVPPNTPTVRVVSTIALPGQSVNVVFEFLAFGGERRISFTTNYNAAVMTDPIVTLGSGVPVGTGIITDISQAAAGRLGITVDSPSDFPAGTRQLLSIAFFVSPGAPPGIYPITFGNSPVPSEIRNSSGSTISSYFQSGFVAFGITAAGVEVSGRVLTPDGRGIRNASVSLVGADGLRRVVTTSSFGIYRFEDVEAGGSYIVSVGSKRYNFSPRIVQVVDPVTDLDFIGN